MELIAEYYRYAIIIVYTIVNFVHTYTCISIDIQYKKIMVFMYRFCNKISKNVQYVIYNYA